MSRLKIIQVGAGRWGASWTAVLSSSPHWELVGIVDLDAERLSLITSQTDNVPGFATLEQAASSLRADAALIAVPPAVHTQVALEALERGLHCLIEKPLAETVEDGRKIVERSQASGLRVMVSQNYRFKRGPQTLREVIARGVIGRVGQASVSFGYAPHFSGFRVEMEHPLLLDMAIHHFDQIRGVLGVEPVEVSARTCNPQWSWFRGDAVANVLFLTAEGAMVSYQGSWVSRMPPTTWDGTWEVQGDRGALCLRENHLTLYPSEMGMSVYQKGAVQRAGERLDFDLLPMVEEERWAVLAEFAAALREDREAQTSAADNLRSLGMVLAAVQSARENGQTVRL